MAPAIWITISVIVGLLILVVVAAAVQAGVYAKQDKGVKERLGVPATVPLHSLRTHAALYDLLGRTVRVLRQAHIDTWACAGTALGLARHGEVIPWDDDADLCIWQHDVGRVHANAAAWAEAGLALSSYPLGIKVCIAGEPTGVGIDLFPVQVASNGAIEYAVPWARMLWPREWYSNRDEVYPLAHRRFGPLFLPVARDNMAYLKRAFSPDCLSTVRFQPPHLMNGFERALLVVNPWIPKGWSLRNKQRHVM